MWRLNVEKEKIIVETNNNPAIIDTLKANTYFKYKCVSCGKILISIYDKRHHDIYKQFKCISCRRSIDKSLIGQTKENPYIITSTEDFDNIKLKYGNFIKFNCVVFKIYIVPCQSRYFTYSCTGVPRNIKRYVIIRFNSIKY